MRLTVRLDKAKIEKLREIVHEDDISKLLDFAIDWTLNHQKFVTEALIGPGWDVIFQRKRKTQELKRRVYE